MPLAPGTFSVDWVGGMTVTIFILTVVSSEIFSFCIFTGQRSGRWFYYQLAEEPVRGTES